MDMWPMNRRYYVENIEKIPENAFVTYRHDCFEAQQVAICYNVAHPSIWSSVLGSQEPELQLSQWYAAVDHGGEHGGRGWGSDQKILYWALRTWNGHKIVLDDLSTGFARLDRDRPTMFMDLDRLRRNILDGDFSDYHCLRPYSDYEEVNKLILDSLLIRQC
jgi:hypothetical protein